MYFKSLASLPNAAARVRKIQGSLKKILRSDLRQDLKISFDPNRRALNKTCAEDEMELWKRLVEDEEKACGDAEDEMSEENSFFFELLRLFSSCAPQTRKNR